MDPRRVAKEPEIKEEEVVQVSRTGRTVKTPSKFKEQRRHGPYGRMQLQAGGAARSGVRKPRPRKEGGDEDEDEEEGGGLVDTGSRVGEMYQADNLPEPTGGASSEDRGDELLWSPESVGDAGRGAPLEAYLADALPLVGGPPQNPPSSASAQEHFPTELALMALQQTGGDASMALDILHEFEDREWTKVEERQFRSALAKHKSDLYAISEAVRTKSFAAVVRFFFVEDGLRKKEERERRRELEMLRLSRERGWKDGKPSVDGASGGGSAGGGGGAGGGGARDGAETPFSAADSAARSDLSD